MNEQTRDLIERFISIVENLEGAEEHHEILTEAKSVIERGPFPSPNDELGVRFAFVEVDKVNA